MFSSIVVILLALLPLTDSFGSIGGCSVCNDSNSRCVLDKNPDVGCHGSRRDIGDLCHCSPPDSGYSCIAEDPHNHCNSNNRCVKDEYPNESCGSYDDYCHCSPKYSGGVCTHEDAHICNENNRCVKDYNPNESCGASDDLCHCSPLDSGTACTAEDAHTWDGDRRCVKDNNLGELCQGRYDKCHFSPPPSTGFFKYTQTAADTKTACDEGSLAIQSASECRLAAIALGYDWILSHPGGLRDVDEIVYPTGCQVHLPPIAPSGRVIFNAHQDGGRELGQEGYHMICRREGEPHFAHRGGASNSMVVLRLATMLALVS